MRALFMAVCATLLLAGLPHLYAESTASGDDTYVLHVEQVECNLSHFTYVEKGARNVSGVTYFLYVNGKNQEVNDIAHDEMISFQDSKAVKFPDLELVPGQQGEIDQQKPLQFPSAFDAEGNPTKFDTQGVGIKISATISGVTNCVIPNISTGVNRTNNCVYLKFSFENVTVSFSTNEAAKIEAGYPKHKDYKVPIIRSQHMNGNTQLFLKKLGQWIVMQHSAIGESRYMTYFMKVEKK